VAEWLERSPPAVKALAYRQQGMGTQLSSEHEKVKVVVRSGIPAQLHRCPHKLAL